MRKIVLVVHVSLDGYVSGPNGELDGFPSGEDNLQFVCELTQEADAAMFGRVSYELINEYWSSAKDIAGATRGQVDYSTWYNATEKVVISTTLKNEHGINTTVIDKNIAEEISKLKNSTGKDILIFGSPSLARLLMKNDLIDVYWVFVNPVIFGQGIPLFDKFVDKIKLNLRETRLFKNGEIALKYTVKE